MATSSERSPPPFPDSEDQDVLDSEDVRRDSDEDDLFMSAVSPSGMVSRRPGAQIQTGIFGGRRELANASGAMLIRRLLAKVLRVCRSAFIQFHTCRVCL